MPVGGDALLRLSGEPSERSPSRRGCSAASLSRHEDGAKPTGHLGLGTLLGHGYPVGSASEAFDAEFAP